MKLIQGKYKKSKEYIFSEFKNNYFEFYLPYVDENSMFKEINRFNDESKKLTRFKNSYSGNVIVDLTEWVDEPVNRYFTAFMYFLVDRTLKFENSKLIFLCEQACTDELISAIEEYFDEKIQLIDLGVKTKNNHKKSIGFITENNNKEYREGRNV